MTATTIRVQMAQRKDTAANWTAANPILLSGEIGYETDTKKFKIGDGSSNWNTLAYLPIPDGSGNLTITGNLEIGTTGSLTFEGSTADGFETTLTVTDPTADRTITFPDRSGTVITSGDTGTVTSTMLADGTIVNADISATAEIAVSKLANGTANQVLVTDGTDVSWSDNLTLAGNLTVNGTTTTIDTQTLLVEDKNIEMGVVATPTDATADGGGITLRGTVDKTINWIDSTDSWTSSEHVDLASGKSYRINNTEVLSSTTLGSGVTGSSLTSVGTIGTGVWQGTAIDAAYLDSSVVTTGDTGTVTSTMIADGTIVNADVNASAAIVGTKISPDFGSQNVTTTGTSTAASFTPTSSTAPTNGLYLSAANSVALSTNGNGRLFINATGDVSVTKTGSNDVAFTLANGTASTIFTQSADGNLYQYNYGDYSLIFGTNATQRLRITSTGQLSHIGAGSSGSPAVSFNGSAPSNSLVVDSLGRVSIGTSAVDEKLHIEGAGTQALKLVNTTSGSYASPQLLQIKFEGAGGREKVRLETTDFSANSVGGEFRIFTRNTSDVLTQALVVDQSQRVGIGTQSPQTLLEISSASSGAPALSLLLRNSDENVSSSSNIYFATGSGAVTATNLTSIIRSEVTQATPSALKGELVFFTNSGDQMRDAARIDSSGRLLVGTASARSNYQGGLVAPRLQVEGTDFPGSAAGYVRNSADSNSSALIFGKTRGTTVNSNTIVSANDGLGQVLFQGADGTNLLNAARISGEVDGTPGANDMPGRLVFSTTADGASSPTERLRLTSTGQLRLAGAGITFNGDTATANELDDYEEGTWTPTIAGQTTTGTGTYSVQSGRYTKVGRSVYVAGTVAWSAHDGTGNMRIAGLPFTALNVTELANAVSFTYVSDITIPANSIPIGGVFPNSTVVTLYSMAVAGGAPNGLGMDGSGTIYFSLTYQTA